MSIEVSPDAAEVLRRAVRMGKLDTASGGGVRLRGSKALGGGFDVQVELADGPNDGETVIKDGDLNIYVDPAVTSAIPEAIVALEPQHEIVVVRPTSG
jgi:Fe-S cluster assembly iron-binding protein IscA